MPRRLLGIVVLAAALAACSAEASTGTGGEAPPGDSMVAVFGDGPWAATRSLRVTAPNGDLVIVGEDAQTRRIAFTLVGLAANAIEGAEVTIVLNPNTAPVSGIASLTIAGGGWSSDQPESEGTFVYRRVGDKITGTFALVLFPVPGTAAQVSRSVTNGQFSITLP